MKHSILFLFAISNGRSIARRDAKDIQSEFYKYDFEYYETLINATYDDGFRVEGWLTSWLVDIKLWMNERTRTITKSTTKMTTATGTTTKITTVTTAPIATTSTITTTKTTATTTTTTTKPPARPFRKKYILYKDMNLAKLNNIPVVI